MSTESIFLLVALIATPLVIFLVRRGKSDSGPGGGTGPGGGGGGGGTKPKRK